jgi:hypothetical protein
MSGAVPSPPIMPSWRGAQLKKHRDNFTFYLLTYEKMFQVCVDMLDMFIYYNASSVTSSSSSFCTPFAL